MAATEVKNFDSPDETRPFEGNGKADVVNIGGQTVGRGIFEPGWRWSNNVKPIAGTDSCQVAHLANDHRSAALGHTRSSADKRRRVNSRDAIAPGIALKDV